MAGSRKSIKGLRRSPPDRMECIKARHKSGLVLPDQPDPFLFLLDGIHRRPCMRPGSTCTSSVRPGFPHTVSVRPGFPHTVSVCLGSICAHAAGPAHLPQEPCRLHRHRPGPCAHIPEHSPWRQLQLRQGDRPDLTLRHGETPPDKMLVPHISTSLSPLL